MLCKKYNLLNDVINAISSGEYMSMVNWKRKVKDVVTSHDLKRWKVTCTLYQSLKYIFLDINDFTLSPWWQHAYVDISFVHKSKHIIQLLVGNGRHDYELCKKCNTALVTVEHILFDCVAMTQVRTLLWRNVENHCLPALIQDLNHMNSRDRTIMILNGFNVNYVVEWYNLYNAVGNFIYEMYYKYDLP